MRLAIEPMHPIFAADRGVVSTLAQALDLAEPLPAEAVGVVVDTFHVWWEPGVEEQIARAGRPDRVVPGLRVDHAAAARTRCSPAG